VRGCDVLVPLLPVVLELPEPVRELVLPEPVLPDVVLLVPLDWAKVVAAPSNTTIVDAKSVRRAEGIEVMDFDGFIASGLYTAWLLIPSEGTLFKSPAPLRRPACGL
jgi:hypothetical protein